MGTISVVNFLKLENVYQILHNYVFRMESYVNPSISARQSYFFL